MAALDHLRKKFRQIASTPFEQGWQFRLEIKNAPSDLDLYVKDISYGATEITYDPSNVGATVFQTPKTAEPVTLAMTCRDHADGRIATWFDSLAGRVVNPDGTVNLPAEYLLEVVVMAINEDGSESEREKWVVSPVSRGDTTKSVASTNVFVEMPLTFIQYRSLGY